MRHVHNVYHCAFTHATIRCFANTNDARNWIAGIHNPHDSPYGGRSDVQANRISSSFLHDFKYSAYGLYSARVTDYKVVKISAPVGVISTVCSKWALRLPSWVRIVQPS